MSYLVDVDEVKEIKKHYRKEIEEQGTIWLEDNHFEENRLGTTGNWFDHFSIKILLDRDYLVVTYLFYRENDTDGYHKMKGTVLTLENETLTEELVDFLFEESVRFLVRKIINDRRWMTPKMFKVPKLIEEYNGESGYDYEQFRKYQTRIPS